MNWILLFLFLLTIVICIYINSRLLKYIVTLENKIDVQVQRNENMFQSLKELIHEDFLLNDGRLKKMMYQKERNKIFNGVNVEDQNIEI